MQQMKQMLGQRLEQRMSQSQIQSLDVLAMPTVELRERIAEELAENPALELVRGVQQKLILPAKHTKHIEPREPYYRNDRTISAFSTEASDAFQTFLENQPLSGKVCKLIFWNSCFFISLIRLLPLLPNGLSRI